MFFLQRLIPVSLTPDDCRASVDPRVASVFTKGDVMEVRDQLREIASAMGEQVDEEEIERHIAFCEELDEHISLGEAGEIVKILVASVLLILVRGEYEPKVKRACLFLVALVLHRCKETSPALEQEVRQGLAEIAGVLAWDLVHAGAPEGGVKH